MQEYPAFSTKNLDYFAFDQRGFKTIGDQDDSGLDQVNWVPYYSFAFKSLDNLEIELIVVIMYLNLYIFKIIGNCDNRKKTKIVLLVGFEPTTFCV